MKAKDLRDMADDQLDTALHDRRHELFNLRFQNATGALENTARLKLAKREIARILTVRTERTTSSRRGCTTAARSSSTCGSRPRPARSRTARGCAWRSARSRAC